VSDELRLAHPALASELGFVQRDIELGATVDQALKRFATRTDYEAVRTLSTFIREAQRFGTNITDALRSHADMLRSQREQAAEESAQKASVKILIPTLLLIFPATFVVIVGPAVIQIHEAFAAK
jgi:tight adherence protein C